MEHDFDPRRSSTGSSAPSATWPASASTPPRTWARSATAAWSSPATPSSPNESRLLRQYGWRERYVSDIAGSNSRLDELQAALLRVELRHLDDWNLRRRLLATRYDELLAGTSVTTPPVAPGNEHVYHLYVVRSKQRDALQAYLADHGIATAIHYPVPVHKQPAYRHLVPTPTHRKPIACSRPNAPPPRCSHSHSIRNCR